MAKAFPHFFLVLSFLFSGCLTQPNSQFYELLKEADQAIEVARLAGAEKKCSKEFEKTVTKRRHAEEFFVCSKKEATAMAEEAVKQAKALCPPSEPLPPPKVVKENVDDPDKDGITGSSDKCPQKPEDKDGFKDRDGCPDPDNDQDGIPDEKDGAPNSAENINGYKDEDGIPDELPGRMILKGVNFLPASADFSKGSTKIIKKTAKILKLNPELVVRIEGYASSDGEDEANQKLSQQRAQAVMDLLVWKHLIHPNRIEAVGFGEAKPIASNDTEEGRTKNRRIEFVIISSSRKGQIGTK